MLSLRKDLWPALLYKVWNSEIFKELDRKANWKQRIPHEDVYVEEIDAFVDVHVLPVCQTLWGEGIPTFYSCQGGPAFLRLRDGQYTSNKAYVAILAVDAERVCELLKDRHAYIDMQSIRKMDDRVAVRFDPSDEAQRITWRNVPHDKKNHVQRE